MRLAIFTAINPEYNAVKRAASGRENISVYRIGIGGKHIPTLCEFQTYDAIVLAGLAGGLDPDLKTGDIVVDEISDQRLPRLPMRYGKIECCNEIVGTARAKMELFARTGALAVEMENNAVRKLARDLSLPYMHIRAIADTADDALDPGLLKCLDEFGRVKSIGLIKHLPALPRLARQSKIATNALAAAIDEFLRTLP